MASYSEYRFWSPILDAEAVRLSLFDCRGGEFWMILSALDGKSYRQRRTEALEYMAEAVHLGLAPGEVLVT